MKNKKFLAMLAVCAMVFSGCQGGAEYAMNVKSSEDGVVTVTAENAAAKSGGTGYVTVEEGQKLEVAAELAGNIQIEVVTEENTEEVLLNETITGSETYTFALPADEYIVRIAAEEGATGSVTIDGK